MLLVKHPGVDDILDSERSEEHFGYIICDFLKFFLSKSYLVGTFGQ